jgi:transcriptional regulator of acetoin/glycerol metabolism
MASLGVTANDIKYALSEQNGQFVIGTLGAPPLETPQDRQMLIKALDKNGGNRKKAAQELGISDRTLYRRIKQYGLDE